MEMKEFIGVCIITFTAAFWVAFFIIQRILHNQIREYEKLNSEIKKMAERYDIRTQIWKEYSDKLRDLVFEQKKEIDKLTRKVK